MWELALPVVPCLAVLVWCLRGPRWMAVFTRPHRLDTGQVQAGSDGSEIGRG